jgi:hypothetical protein
VVAFAIPPLAAARENADADLPGSLKKEAMLDGWIRIGADGTITVLTGKAELGQGITTAILQLAAEELVVSPSRIKLLTADTAQTADEGYTAGSHSMQDSGTAVRHAAAQMRAILLELAATRFKVPVGALVIRDGVIVAPDGSTAAYHDLLKSRELHRRAGAVSDLRKPAQYRLIGKPFQRIDIPAKVFGDAAYVQDLRVPGMVHARRPSAQRHGAPAGDGRCRHRKNVRSIQGRTRRPLHRRGGPARIPGGARRGGIVRPTVVGGDGRPFRARRARSPAFASDHDSRPGHTRWHQPHAGGALSQAVPVARLDRPIMRARPSGGRPLHGLDS